MAATLATAPRDEPRQRMFRRRGSSLGSSARTQPLRYRRSVDRQYDIVEIRLTRTGRIPAVINIDRPIGEGPRELDRGWPSGRICRFAGTLGELRLEVSAGGERPVRIRTCKRVNLARGVLRLVAPVREDRLMNRCRDNELV